MPTLATYRPRLEVLEDRTAPAVLTVNSNIDTANASDTYLSLREAIAIVNSSTLPSGLSPQILGQISGTLHGNGSDSILFNLNRPITLGGSQLELSLPSAMATITIDGGTAGVTVDGNQANLILLVDSGVQADLTHLTLQNGAGGIDNEGGTITLQDCQITHNTAFLAGGIYNNQGSVTLTDTSITFNSASTGNGLAGGLLNEGGDVQMTNCVVASNSAASDGGGIYNTGEFLFSGPIVGIHDVVNGTLTLTNCTVSGNHADGSGGGLVNAFPPDVHVWNLYRPGEPFPATMTLSGCTLDRNMAGGNGGAAAVFAGSLTMTACTLNGNSAYQYGGGMYIDPAVATIISSTISGNSAP